MAHNRAHKTAKEVIRDVIDGPPENSALFLIVAIDRFFNNELELTAKNKQTGLLFMGIHASILTLSKALFDNDKIGGYKKFLEEFVDGKEEDKKFSKIAEQLHGWRNILAHRFISEAGHEIEYDYEMNAGYVLNDGGLLINPSKYLDQYLSVFKTQRLHNYVLTLEPGTLSEIKERIVGQYIRK